jgi:UDP-glucose 4-epimerase
MRRVVVTGGAGFIGSNLVDRLLADGCAVVCIDNLRTGNRRNIEAARSRSAFTFIEGDINDSALLAAAFAGADTIFHFAALADIVPSIERPRDYYVANVDGTFNVVEAARSAGVRRLIYAASSSCYGLPEIFPTPEDAAAAPRYPYALTKYLGEQIVMHWCAVYGIQTVSLRFFNVYGPRARTTGTYGAVFGVFLAQKLAGKPFTVVGDGTQTRDFTHVSDVVDAVVCAADADVSGEIFNVGSGGTYSINELIGLLGGPVTHIPVRPGEPFCTFADVSKIAARLGWSARVPFARGVAEMLAAIEDWHEAPIWEAESIAAATQTWFKYLAPAGVAGSHR